MKRILTTSAPAHALGWLLLSCSGEAAAQGAEFNLSCNADEVLVGISGRQGWWMEGIAARCRLVEPNGALAASIRSTDYAGGTTGILRTFDCRPAEVMVGYRGAHGDNGYVLHVEQILCAPWQSDTRRAGKPATPLGAFDSKSAPGRSMVESCPDGRVGTRLRGRAGQYLDKLLDIGCSYANTPTPATAERGQT